MFPEAFAYEWERADARAVSAGGRRDPGAKFVLMVASKPRQGGATMTLGPKEKEERKMVFRARLFSMAKDHHKEFLKGIVGEQEVEEATSWHKQFQIESCPDVEEVG